MSGLPCATSTLCLVTSRQPFQRRPKGHPCSSPCATSGCLMQLEFCLAFRGMMPDRTLTTVRHCLHWPPSSWTRSHADLRWYPLRPIRTHCRCFLWLKRSKGKKGGVLVARVKQVTTDHVGSYFEPAPANCCAVSKRGARAGHAAFSPIGLVAVPICAGPKPSPRDPNPPWWRSAKNETVLRQSTC